MNTKTTVTWVGILLGFGLLLFFLIQLDWALFWQALQGLRPLYIGLMVLSCLGGSTLRALRCGVLLRAMLQREKIPLFSWGKHLRLSWQALYIGIFGNMVYPAKAGEVMRVFYLHKAFDTTAGTAITAATLDRVMDVLGVLSIGLALTYTFLPTSPLMRNALFSLGMALGVILLLGVLFIIFHQQCHKIIRYILTPFPAFLREKCLALLGQTIDAIMSVQRPSTLGLGLFCTGMAFFCDALACWALLLAFGWTLPFAAGLSLELAFCVAGSLPSAPGYLGVYQAAAVFVLSGFGHNVADGIAVAMIEQLVWLLLSGCICGLIHLYSPKNERK